MRRVLCSVLLLTLGIAPALEARVNHKAQLSRRELRKRYVAKPFNKKGKHAPKAKWGGKGH